MLLLAIVVLLPMVTGLDLCHDPRTSDFNRSCNKPSFAVHIPSVDGNPNHALHDTLWAVSHYFLNCARHPLTLYVPATMEHGLCEEPDVGPQPDWGLCVAYILAKNVGAKVDTADRGVGDAGKGVCHTTETVLRQKTAGWPESFRGQNWFVDYGDGLGHVRLQSDDLARAFRHIRSSVRGFYGLLEGGRRDEVKVLIYDRSDARRRRWGNAHDVVEMVRKMADVRVEYIQSIPVGLGKQVELFGRTDLVIAPHGAAMANTVFMREEAGVVEIAKECVPGWAKHRGSAWTWWHARLLGLKLVYVDCQNGTNSTYRVDAGLVEKAVLRLMPEIRESWLRQRAWDKMKMRSARKDLFMPIMIVVLVGVGFATILLRRQGKHRVKVMATLLEMLCRSAP